jgi:hypothetical protein
MAAKSISIPVTGNTAPLRKSLTKAERDLQRFSKQADAKMKSAAKAFAVAAGGAVLMASRMNKAYEEMSTANARILQVAQSMGVFGSEVGVVSDRLQKLARATALQTGVDANSIKLTQAKLLTFKALAVSAGEVGGAFDRATAAAIDMAAAGFGEASSNAVQLGKALNDPIKGITALNKSGISFTAQEKEKIRTLVESNRVTEAQALILAAIETQVGGTAAATANASDKMREGMRVVKEEIGRGLAPAFESLAGQAVKFGEWAEKNGPTVAALATAFTLLGVAVMGVKLAMTIATAASAAFALAQTGLAAANLAVQISTGIGIATALASAAAIVVVTKKVYDNAKANRESAAAALSNAGAQNFLTNALQGVRDAFAIIDAKNEAEAEAAKGRAEAEAAAAKAKAQAIIRAEKERFKSFKENLEKAKEQIRSYVQSLTDAINSEVSLGSAFSNAAASQQDAQDKITQALQERRDAYNELQQAQATGDAKQYGAALEKVAAAEKSVKDAQEIKPKNYSQIFAEQIAAAKSFATYIGQLAKAGLGKAGLAQILDLGPIAGAQVAKDMLTGASGMTVESLKADLAAIQATGTAAGMEMPGFSQTLGAQAVRVAPNEYYITIEAGMSSPTDIAKTVETVLQTYGGTQGGIAVTTKPPKAAPKKKKTKR